MKTANNKGYKCFQPKTFYYNYDSSEKSGKVRLQLYLLYLDNNLFKNISNKLLDLRDLARAQILYVYKLTKVDVVTKSKNFVFAAFDLVFLCFKSCDNS